MMQQRSIDLLADFILFGMFCGWGFFAVFGAAALGALLSGLYYWAARKKC